MKTYNPIQFWLYRLWAIWLVIHFSLFFLVTYPFFYLFLRNENTYPKAHLLRKFWGKSVFLFSGIRTKVFYETPLDFSKTYIIVPNHSSYFDIPAVTVMLPLYFNFMAKHELKKIPLFRIFFGSIDIAVDRKNMIKSHQAFKEAADRLQKDISLCLFPEGTIHATAPKLSKFKDGAFRLAIEQNIPLLPITLPDNYWRLPEDKYICTPGLMRMFVHKPIYTDSLTIADTKSLKQEVFSIIENKLKEYESYG